MRVIYTTFFVCLTFFLSATTIRPFASLEDLHDKSTCIALTQFDDSLGHVLIRAYKGEFNQVRPWGNDTMIILGDPIYQHGVNYLLFLDEIDKPICLSYYVFAQTDSFFVRSPEAEGIGIVGDPPRHNAYLAEELLEAIRLKDYTKLTQYNVPAGPRSRAAPGHCGFLQNSQGTRYRWNLWDTSHLPLWVYGTLGGDATCVFANTTLDDGVDSMRMAYMGTNLRTGDPHMYQPNCAGSSAVNSHFRNWVLTEYGDEKRVIVQYNDPCGEISDLFRCSGTLAVGGLFATSAHIFDGAAWFTGGFGFVVTNNGIGCIGCTRNFRTVLQHELGHAMGMGHISQTYGVAQMNPTCCNEITHLDSECADYLYPPELLPVEFVDVSGRRAPGYNEIRWTIGAEINTEKYVLEISTDGRNFTEYTSVPARQAPAYAVIHWAAYGAQYYRIKAVDWDGTITLSKILYIARNDLINGILRNPIPEGDMLELYAATDEQITISDTLGRVFLKQYVQKGFTQVWTDLRPGTYIVTFSFSREKFVIIII